MINEQNLIPFSQRTEEEQRAIRVKGGKASVEKRRELKAARERLKELLLLPIHPGEVDSKLLNLDEAGEKNLSTYDLVLLAQVKKALKGDNKAFNDILALMGQNAPTEEKDNSFVDALNGKASEVWNEEE